MEIDVNTVSETIQRHLVQTYRIIHVAQDALRADSSDKAFRNALMSAWGARDALHDLAAELFNEDVAHGMCSHANHSR